MLKRISQNFIDLRRGSRGSAIVVVLVTMTFIVVLVSVLLYLSMINIQMKKIDKGAKSNFYTAESAMEEIRAGVQASVSEAIKKAYTTVLENYVSYSLNSVSEEQQLRMFHDAFYEELYGSGKAPELFLPGGAGYDVGTIRTFVSQSAGTDVAGTQAIQQIFDANGDREYILLKDISVTYISGGFQTEVTSDIRINAPPLPYTWMGLVQTPAPEFAIVAKGSLQQLGGGGAVGVNGSVYAGGLTVGGAGNAFNVQNAKNFVLAGPVEVNGGTLNFSVNSALWASNILLNTAGKITLAGDAYIANDLNLSGNGVQAELSGRYFGYGNSTSDPGLSSAILINGRDTLLDMSALRALMLAGRGFVDYNAGAGSTVLTGESISVKSNQLAYLVPESCLKSGKTNPYVYTGNKTNEEFQEECIQLDPALATYGIVSPADNVQYIRKTIGTTSLVYFCLKFTTTNDANAYFRDYFNANGPSIQKYMNVYSNGILLLGDATKNLSGEAFTFDGVDLGPVIDGYGVSEKSIEGVKTSRNNLCVTLSRTDTVYDGATNAYDYFVDGGQLAQVFGTAVYTSGSVKTAVTNGDYTVTDSDVHLVIAGGNVTVTGAFTGLIFAGGNVTLNGSVTMDSALVSEALKSLVESSGGVYVYKYLNPRHISPLNSGSNDDDIEVWDLSTLVIYQNWAKNKDES
jgi:hypothetical protein